jgi:small-conductance mechanosensitive channel
MSCFIGVKLSPVGRHLIKRGMFRHRRLEEENNYCDFTVALAYQILHILNIELYYTLLLLLLLLLLLTTLCIILINVIEIIFFMFLYSIFSLDPHKTRNFGQYHSRY